MNSLPNTYRILKSELNSPSVFKRKKEGLIKEIIQRENIEIFDYEELSEILLSAFRVNDFDIVKFEGNKGFLDERNVLKYIKEKLIPNTIVISMDDEDLVRLLVFSIEIVYRMFERRTGATITQKGFRERKRTFESILVDQFIGKLGEVMVKKFLEKSFPTKIELDWDISTETEKHKNDIANAKKKVSIRTSTSLSGIWAEADRGYDYGIAVKCSVPQPLILQFLIEVCGFSRLLDFVSLRIPYSDSKFQDYLQEIRNRVKNHKCGEMQTKFKGFVCGYFKTSEYNPVKEGTILPYLGKVRESRYLVSIKELRYTRNDWMIFLKETGL